MRFKIMLGLVKPGVSALIWISTILKFSTLLSNLEKLKMRKFLLSCCMQIICKFFFQNLCNPIPYVIGFLNSEIRHQNLADNLKWVKTKI